MPKPAPISEEWVDIIPPAAPPHVVDPLITGIVVAVLLTLICVAAFLYRRPRARAKRALRRLARDLGRSQIEIKPACFRIRACLRSGFGQRHLQSVRWSDDNHTRWLAYVNRLTHCCFAPEPPAMAELNSVIHEAVAWLNKKADT